MTSRVLVVFATRSGCTETIAGQVAAGLAGPQVVVDVRGVQARPDPAGYDAVVIGSGVRIGRWHASARRWMAGNARLLAQRPVALFTVGTTLHLDPGRAGEVRGYTDRMLAATSLRPIEIGLFPGWYLPDRFGRVERVLARAAKIPTGDFRDPDAVRSWAAEIRPRLVPAASSHP